MAYGIIPGWWAETNRNPPLAPVVSPAPQAVQPSFPTSAYGETIPVVYGKFRSPGAYVWAGVTSRTNHSTGNLIVKLTARVRFARPLVADSTWSLRRLWADGKVIFDGATGIRSHLIEYLKAYDGRSTQARDPIMVEEEGEANVSAHRGYLDIVIRTHLLALSDRPPVFEAEWVQDAVTSFDEEDFTAFYADPVNTWAAPDWEAGDFYGVSNDTPIDLVRRFNIGSLREIYAVPLVELSRAYNANDERCLRYIPAFGKLINIATATDGSGRYGILIDPVTGQIVAESAGMAALVQNTSGCVIFENSAVMVGVENGSVKLFILKFTNDSVSLEYKSASAWEGYAAIECVTAGEVRGDEADVWLCADDKLVKIVINSSGAIRSKTVFATLPDNAVYAVVHEGDVVVWTDNAQARRIDGTTAATVWTVSVPYQIEHPAVFRNFAPPDIHRFDGTFMYPDGADGKANFTDLDSGATTELTVGGIGARDVYDGVSKWMITTDNAAVPVRTVFDVVGDGTTRDLEDFLAALTEADGAFSSAEHDEVGIDDQIQGAVIDVTTGIREVARSCAEPYSFAIFERAGQIIYKRAASDGAFAVDATIVSTDIVDRGGQAIRARRFNPEEFIARYGINYRDPDEIYQSRPQYGEIPAIPFPVSPTDLAVKADIPIIMDGDTIKTLATKKVNRLAIEKHEFTMTLRAKFCDLEPEDIIRFTYANRTITARIIEAVMMSDFTIEVKATEFLTSTSITVSGAVGRPVEPTPVGNPRSSYYHLDIPLQSDTHDLASAGFVQYHALGSAGQLYWDGATLYRREPDGAYIPVSAQAADALVLIALEALPDADNPYVTEFTRTLDVALYSGDADLLTSVTYLQMMNGANKFAIGRPGRWEICHVQTISGPVDGVYTFETLVRGRGVSEEHCGDHEIGDLVVWLMDDNIQRLDYELDTLGDVFTYKPVGFGGTIAGAIATTATITGEAEKIPKPAQLDAVRDGTKLVLSWVRRSRIGVVWDDDGDFSTPLGETLEQYVIRIKSGPGGSVLRTFTVNDATSQDYTDAQQTTDFGSTIDPGESLTFDVRQVSGTGVVCPTREATITL